MKTAAATPPRRFTPWTIRQRPGGDWVVQQFDRTAGKSSRFGPFPTETEARIQRDLLTENT